MTVTDKDNARAGFTAATAGTQQERNIIAHHRLARPKHSMDQRTPGGNPFEA